MAVRLVLFEVVVCGRISVWGVRSWWKFLNDFFEEMVYGSSFCLRWWFVVEASVCNGSSACFIWGGGLKQNFCLRCQFMVEVSDQSGGLWWKPLFDVVVHFCLRRFEAVLLLSWPFLVIHLQLVSVCGPSVFCCGLYQFVVLHYVYVSSWLLLWYK
jgi:hypothetical protein